MDYAAAEPTAIRAGDTVTWSREMPEHSAADGWALKYRLLYPSGAAVEIATTGAGTTHSVTLSATTTAAWASGAATLVALAEKGSGAGLERVTLESQPVTILPNLATAATLDNRSQAAKALADAQAALAAYMGSGRLHVAGYSIAGRQMQFRSADEIQALIKHYEAEVGKERALLAALSGGAPGRVVCRM